MGLDLGLTNSCITTMEGNEVRVIENAEGFRMTPSFISYTEDGQILAGVAAKKQVRVLQIDTYVSKSLP